MKKTTLLLLIFVISTPLLNAQSFLEKQRAEARQKLDADIDTYYNKYKKGLLSHQDVYDYLDWRVNGDLEAYQRNREKLKTMKALMAIYNRISSGRFAYGSGKDFLEKQQLAKQLLADAVDNNEDGALYESIEEYNPNRSPSSKKLGLKNTDAEYIKYLKMALDRGKKDIAMVLAQYYETKKDYSKALKWYKTYAADFPDDGESLYKINTYYRNGQGTEKDLDLANQFLIKSVNNKYGGAIYDYGRFLYFGQGGFQQDQQKAIAFFSNYKDWNYIGESIKRFGRENNIPSLQ